MLVRVHVRVRVWFELVSLSDATRKWRNPFFPLGLFVFVKFNEYLTSGFFFFPHNLFAFRVRNPLLFFFAPLAPQKCRKEREKSANKKLICKNITCKNIKQ